MQVTTFCWFGLLGSRLPNPPPFYVPAIGSLGGRGAETKAKAYDELHRLTGQGGRLKHVECLLAGEWDL